MSDPPDGRLKITPTTLPDNAGLVEIVAKALYLHDGGTEEEWEMLNPVRWHGRAEAAIAALRPSVWMDISTEGFVMVPIEPYPIMVAAADAICPVSRGSESHRMGGGVTPEAYYRAMIAAHLCDHDWQHNTDTEEVCLKCGSSRPTPPKAPTP